MRSKPQLSIIKGPYQEITPCSLHKLFENNFLHSPGKPALIYNEKKVNRILTYQEVNSKANQFARVILRESLEHSLKPNQDGDYIIAVCMEPSDELIMVLLAAWKAGAAYIVIDPILTSNRISHIVNESRPIMVICDNNIDQKLFGQCCAMNISELNHKAIQMEVINIFDGQMLNITTNLAIVLYTSGSTGVPKGVKLSHVALLNRLQWQWTTFPFTADEVVGVFKTSLNFVDSVTEIWSSLLYGLAVLVVPRATTKDPEKLVKLLEEYKIGRIVLVPTLLRSICIYLLMNRKTQKSTVQQVLPNLRNWVCSGEPLQKQLVEQFFECFKEGTHVLHNFYGCTEVTGDVTYYTFESKEHLDEVPIGLPISNTVIYILDQDYRPVRHGEIGEIYISGLNLANGYMNGRDPDRFIDNPLAQDGSKFLRLYNTGDFGSFQNGNIYFEGRTDSQIKIRGHRVDLNEVEKTILSMNVVERAIVLCYHVHQIARTLVAFVQLNDKSHALTGLEIEVDLKDKLPDYMIPQVMIIDDVPLLVNGKVDRQALLRSYEDTKKEFTAFDLAEVPDEMKLIARNIFRIVGSVIGLSTRGTLTMNSNFYEMGGNSLNSMTTVSLLREKGYNIEISDFISARNLGEICYKIVNKLKITEGGNKLPHLNMKAFPLTADDKEDYIEILADSFYERGELEYWVKKDVKRQDYVQVYEDVWDDALNKKHSFTVKDMNTNKTIGIAVNFDFQEKPKVQINSFVDRTFDIVAVLEAPFRENVIPVELNKVMYCYLIGTSSNLSPQENIACTFFMEDEIIKLAKRSNFMGVLTTNTSPLTQQLAKDVFNYRCLIDYQINKYIHKDGTNPFRLAPDSQRTIVCYKEL